MRNVNNRVIFKISCVIIIAIIIVIAVGIGFSAIQDSLVVKRYDSIHADLINAIDSSFKNKISDIENPQKADFLLALKDINEVDDVFIDIIVVDTTGKVIVSTDSHKYMENSAFIFNLKNKNIEEVFANPNGGIAPYKDNGKTIYLTFNAFGGWDNHRIIGVLPDGIYEFITVQNTVYRFLEFFILILVVIGVCTACVFTLKHRNDFLYNVKNTGSYLLSITEKGKILSADQNFKERFDIDTLENSVLLTNKPFSFLVKSGNVLVLSLKDKQGENVGVLANSASSVGCYKLVGAEATDYVDEYIKFRHANMVDKHTEFWNRVELENHWFNLQEKNISDAMMVFFTIRNYDYYKKVWGSGFADNMIREYANRVKDVVQSYGMLFTIDDGLDILFVSDPTQKELFMTNIDDIFDLLNQSTTVEGQSLLLDIRGGVINFDMKRTIFTLNLAVINGKNALKYACQSDIKKYFVSSAIFIGDKEFDIRTKEGILSLLQSGLIDVWYQPQMDVNIGKVVSVEALLRIVGSEAKQINIQDFIISAEKTGCMVELGEFIYKRAMDGAMQLKKMGVSVSINISPIQLMQIGFLENFLQEYENRKLNAGDIHIEIVESVLIHSIKETILKIEALKKHGIKVEIDDFGTGYSSLAYLRDMKVDIVKLDRMFVKELEQNAEDRIIVKNILALLKELGMESVVEGVSTEGQVKLLKEMGCSVIQGYWLAKALPIEKVSEFIKEINKEW